MYCSFVKLPHCLFLCLKDLFVENRSLFGLRFLFSILTCRVRNNEARYETYASVAE